MNKLRQQHVLADAGLDLGLYIENLFTRSEADTEPQTLLETEHLQVFLDEELGHKQQQPAEQIQQAVLKEETSLPDWAEQTFECLLIKLGGMKLLLPAMSVAYIERINKKITRIPLDTEAFKGVITLRGKSIAVIDLFSLIAENAVDYEQSMKVDSQFIDHVLVMEDGHYALACDAVDKILVLNKEAVRWNKASFNNPMFMGVVTEYLCPLLNIEHLYQQVKKMPFVQSLSTNNN